MPRRRYDIDLENSGKIYDSKIVKRLMKYLKPYKWLVVVSIVFLFITSAADISIPFISKMVIDKYINPAYQIIKFDTADAKTAFTEKYNEYTLTLSQYKAAVKNNDMDRLLRKDFQALQENEQLAKGLFFLFPLDRYDEKELSQIKNYSKNYPNSLTMFDEYLLFSEGSKRAAAGNSDAAEETDEKLPKEAVSLIRSKDVSDTVTWGLILFAVMIGNFLFTFLQVYITTYMGQNVLHDIRIKIFNHIQKMPMKFFDNNPIGKLVTRATNDVEALNQMFTDVLVFLFKDFFLLFGIIIALLLMNWKLALATFTILPIITIVTIFFRIKSRNAYRKVRIKLSAMNAFLAEHISGMKIIQIFNQEKKRFSIFTGYNTDLYEAELYQIFIFAVFRPLISMSRWFAAAIILYYGGGQVIKMTLSIGALTAFLSYMEMFFRPIRDLSEKYNIMQSAMASSERIFNILDKETEEDLYDGKEKPAYDDFKGNIEFKNVWFAYKDEEYVLRDVSFKVNKGEKVAIVGATGAGKTSIINILTKFYPYQKGCIAVDGIDIKDWDTDLLRTHIGMVQQDVFLFSGNIKHNITLNEEMSMERIEKAAEYTNADSFINKLQDRFDTEVTERGETFSEGQRQLVAFSRVLAYDPEILILDEATSNIDSETEHLIQEAILKLIENRTAIIIAHRLSTIQHADKIIVLHKGKIKEVGSHQELLKKRGMYYNLYLLQYKNQFNNGEEGEESVDEKTYAAAD